MASSQLPTQPGRRTGVPEPGGPAGWDAVTRASPPTCSPALEATVDSSPFPGRFAFDQRAPLWAGDSPGAQAAPLRGGERAHCCPRARAPGPAASFSACRSQLLTSCHERPCGCQRAEVLWKYVFLEELAHCSAEKGLGAALVHCNFSWRHKVFVGVK